jgi:hypothetical protein
MHTRHYLAFGLAFLFLASGCGKDDTNRGAVSGQVTLDGKPLKQGSILFTPIEGTKGVVAGGQIQDGQYCLVGVTGPAIGTNRVEIQAMRKNGKMIPKALGAPGEMVEGFEQAVAARFNSDSTLKITITPGENTANFDVTSK